MRFLQTQIYFMLVVLCTYVTAAEPSSDHGLRNYGNQLELIFTVDKKTVFQKKEINDIKYTDGCFAWLTQEATDEETKSKVRENPQDTIPEITFTNNAFYPKYLSIKTGSAIKFVNDHNAKISLILSDSKQGSFSIFPKSVKSVEFNELFYAPKSIIVESPVHVVGDTPYVLVCNSHYHSTSDKDGKIMFSGIYNGVYKLRMWHKKNGYLYMPDKTDGIKKEHAMVEFKDNNTRVKYEIVIK